MKAAGLAEPTHYVLKIVQAGVAAGCPALDVGVERDTLLFRFGPADCLFLSGDHYAASLLTLASLPQGWLRHLAVGINAAAGAEMAEISWRTPGGSIVLTGQELRVEEPFEGFELRFRKQRRLWRSLFGTQFAAEYVTLQTRCLFAPLDLTIDSRPIERPFAGRYTKTVAAQVVPYLMCESVLAGSGLRLGCPPPNSYHELREGIHVPSMTFKDAPSPLVLFGSPGSDTLMSVAGVVGILPITKSQGTVVFVKDGVALHPWSGSLGNGNVIAIVDGADLSVDLTEFKAVEDPTFLSKVEELREFVAAEIERLEIADLNRGFPLVSPIDPRGGYELLTNWLWLRKSESPKELFPVEASEVLLGVEPYPSEKILLSLSAVKRFPVHAHLNCRAIATNRRLIFWDADSAKHSWFLLWSEVERFEVKENYHTDLHFVRRGEPTLEMALASEEDVSAMKAAIEEQLEIRAGS